MKIIIDDKIPYIREAVAKTGARAVYIKGADISPADVADADALIVRTRTRCDERLLGGSSVRFVATATIGYDHIDTGYLSRAGIGWANCPGCNAGSVAQYVRASLILLERAGHLHLQGGVMGIVGCGHVGGKVKAVAEGLGMRVLVNDPPQRALYAAAHGEAEAGRHFVGLDAIERESDVISFHVPMVLSGQWPTHHLADRGFLGRLARRPVIMNTSRGAVVDNPALRAALRSGQVRACVIDTWENEPYIDRELMREAFIATPHIAGYSADGKVNAGNMALGALCRFFHIAPPEPVAPPPLQPGFTTGDPLLPLYSPMDDSRRLKSHPEMFEELRGNYPLRREEAWGEDGRAMV